MPHRSRRSSSDSSSRTSRQKSLQMIPQKHVVITLEGTAPLHQTARGSSLTDQPRLPCSAGFLTPRSVKIRQRSPPQPDRTALEIRRTLGIDLNLFCWKNLPLTSPAFCIPYLRPSSGALFLRTVHRTEFPSRSPTVSERPPAPSIADNCGCLSLRRTHPQQQ